MEVSSHALALHRVDGTRVRRRRVHQPRPRPPRPARHRGGVLRGQGAAVRAASWPRSASSTSTTRTAACCSTPRDDRRWCRSRCADATDVEVARRPRTPSRGGASRVDGRRSAGAFNVMNALAAADRPRPRSASTPTTIVAGLRRRRAGARPVRARQRAAASGVRRDRRLRPHARRPGEVLAAAARSSARWPGDRRVRLRRRPRPRRSGR